MEEIAKISSILGHILLLLALCGGAGAFLFFPVQATSGPDLREPGRDRFALSLSLLAWPVFALVTMSAVWGELFTRYAVAGLGYIYIVLGMPAYLFAWLGLMVLSTIRYVPASMMLSASVGGAVVIMGFLGIN